jgi:hypothetical protein
MYMENGPPSAANNNPLRPTPLGGVGYLRQARRDLGNGRVENYRDFSLERARQEAQRLLANNRNASSMHSDGDIGKNRAIGIGGKADGKRDQHRSAGGSANFKNGGSSRIGSIGAYGRQVDEGAQSGRPGLSKPPGLTPIKRPDNL